MSTAEVVAERLPSLIPLPVAGLFQPTGLTVGSHGAVYVSNFGSSTATAAHPGQILKITGLS
jgi:hypothetical protein